LKRFHEEASEINHSLYPRAVISESEEFFQQLYRLLLREDHISEEVWQILIQLPTARCVEAQVLQLSEESVTTVFDDTSRFQLLYVLMVVKYFLEDAQ